MCSSIDNQNLMLQIKGNFNLVWDHQQKWPFICGVSFSMKLAAFVKGNALVNDQSVKLG
jgi:hypothetical protein